ncbi:MAG: T9SS type A sorting domain-containing protein, partial [Bacteroidales bacterium]
KRYTATVAMNNCINAGFFTENAVLDRTTTAWFDHAEIVGYLKESDEEFSEINDPSLFEVNVYPNPANDRITISIPENEVKVSVTLINASGLVVETSEFNTMDAEYPISHIKPGLYLLRFERSGMIVSKRLVVL